MSMDMCQKHSSLDFVLMERFNARFERKYLNFPKRRAFEGFCLKLDITRELLLSFFQAERN